MLAYYNLDIIQGSTFFAQLSIKNSDNTPVNLTGYGVRGHIKSGYSSNSILLDLKPTVNTDSPLTAASGVINIRLEAEDTALLPIIVGVYDIETYIRQDNKEEVNKVLDGKVYIHPEVTKL